MFLTVVRAVSFVCSLLCSQSSVLSRHSRNPFQMNKSGGYRQDVRYRICDKVFSVKHLCSNITFSARPSLITRKMQPDPIDFPLSCSVSLPSTWQLSHTYIQHVFRYIFNYMFTYEYRIHTMYLRLLLHTDVNYLHIDTSYHVTSTMYLYVYFTTYNLYYSHIYLS